MVVLDGERVRLRPWRGGDRQGFRAMGADPRVMEFMPSLLSAAAADDLAGRIAADLDRRDWGLWALEVPEKAEFGGFVGLKPVPEDLPFAPAVEVAWRLAPALWGQGYATEAARLALAYGFAVLKLPEIVSFTALPNLRSQAVMRRLDMTAVGEFEHSALPPGHWLRRHVLYRKNAS